MDSLCNTRNFIVFQTLYLNMKNRIFNQILEYMVSFYGEFKYESNGSFGNENRAKTKKLWSKQVRRE